MLPSISECDSEDKRFGMLPPMGECDSEDKRFMLEALKEALKAFQKGEVPVGAVIVREGRVVARGYNQVELLKDATAHAEMIAMTSASSEVDNWRLADCTLYSTLEPCTMCLGASFLSRIKTIVFAAPDIRHGALGSWVNLLATPHPTHTIEVRSKVFEAYSANLLRVFFQQERLKKRNG
ncbi:MAG: hypothetical protein K0S07_1012 [Chlamydiales bacterium]|jgi:tRNA(adenine34) deaminase|nr:hypothetical protein [Chlamydiales bacterium]